MSKIIVPKKKPDKLWDKFFEDEPLYDLDKNNEEVLVDENEEVLRRTTKGVHPNPKSKP